jgi:nucleoside-diphosphate-sugar epimerase/glycosyltransferase involved in cell wall biosynthesis
MSLQVLTNDEELIHAEIIRQIQGPILVTGVGGFIGSVAFNTLLNFRSDVYGIARNRPGLRSKALSQVSTRHLDLLDQPALEATIAEIRPRTIFNFAAVGAYPTQNDLNAMIEINTKLVAKLGQWCLTNDCALIHSGTSSEYGSNCSGPNESEICVPNSMYSATKLAGTHLLQQLGRETDFRCVVLRFYSIFGPLESPSRLIPTLLRTGLEGRLPNFSSPRISRDFTYVIDAIEAAWLSAVYLTKNTGTFVFNIGSGVPTSMSDVARIAKEVFSIKDEPVFSSNLRHWDLEDWYSNPRLAAITLGWAARTGFTEGFHRTLSWYQQSPNRELLLIDHKSTSSESDVNWTLSAIVACYKDERAIPIIYERLVATFQQIGCDYEIVFVNDASPDNSEAVLAELISSDPRVIGITHMRNFGSQAAFISGMKASKGDACVLLDGDLQDPPELIVEFCRKWREGYDVVYGIRQTREASAVMQIAYKCFYKIYSSLSGFPVPRDAGDFSLMSRQVVNALLKFPERDLFLRTNRAYIGGRQVGVPYHRPERAFGTSTNSPLKNLQWAVRGILSSSRKPLSALSVAGISTSVISILGLFVQLGLGLLVPDAAPRGFVTVILLVGVFGSLNLLAISVVGEYVGRILDEVRSRPRYVRRHVKSSANDL